MGSRFRDKVVLITGGGSGIGRAATELFADEEARIIIADLDATAGVEVASRLESSGTDAVFIPVDVTKARAVQALVEKSIKRFGRLDTLFHTAGIFETGLLTEVDEGHWQRLVDVNLRGTFLVLKYVVPALLLGGGGTIVTTASVAGYAPFPNNPVYCASKAGVIMLTKCAASDYGELGIRANVICPGPVAGPMMERAFQQSSDGEADRKLLEQRTLLKRMATHEEIARVALFLASDESSYITGESILIDGGKLTMNK